MATEDRIYFARRAAEEQELRAGRRRPRTSPKRTASCSAPISSAPASASVPSAAPRADRLISPRSLSRR